MATRRRQPQRGRRGAARARRRGCGAAWRRNARRLPLPAALADRLLRPDARADAGLALSLLHRLRPADAAALGRARELRLRLLPGRAASGSALGVTFTYVLWSVPLKLAAALGARHGARPQRPRRRRLPRDLLPAVAARRLGRHRRALAADLRRRRAWSTSSSPLVGIQGRPGSRTPTTRSRRWSCSRSGSSARR